MKTKEKILLQSIELFNRNGVSPVTTNHIAKALNNDYSENKTKRAAMYISETVSFLLATTSTASIAGGIGGVGYFDGAGGGGNSSSCVLPYRVDAIYRKRARTH